MVIRIPNYENRFGPWGKFVHNSTKLIYLEITGYRIKYNVMALEVPSFTVHLSPLNAKLNPICHLLALLEAHPILHISRVRVNDTSSSPQNYPPWPTPRSGF
jgi:hypothetical protein